MAPDRQTLAESAHRREMRLHIILPFAGGLVLVLVGVVAVVLLPKRLQVSLVADWLLMICFLCPVALCLFPVAVGMVAAAAGLGVLHHKTGGGLARVERLTERALENTQGITEKINQATVDLSVKFAFFDKLLGVFDNPALPPEKDEQDE